VRYWLRYADLDSDREDVPGGAILWAEFEKLIESGVFVSGLQDHAKEANT
jgi:hypothetical protein